MRLDKYLKVSRLIKRRTVANEACDGGHVTVNGRPAKASYDVKVGDVLAITDGDNSYIDPDPQTFTVVGLTGGFVIVKDPLKKLRGEGLHILLI